jgi:tuberous sclerosis protein 2
MPPNQPSLAHARSLALVLRTHSPIPRPAILSPILSSLCAVHSPVSLQLAGYEIISAFFENDEASTLETADRMAYLYLFLSPSMTYSQEIWEPRLRAMRALTKYGTEIFGLESSFLRVLKTWIHGAFEGLLLMRTMDSTERAGRERALEVLTQFLNDVITTPAVVSRLCDEDLDGVLDFYADLVDDALGPAVQGPLRRREHSMLSLSAPDSAAPTISTTTTAPHTHRRHPSSPSVTIPAQPILSPVYITKHPADIAASLYLNHLQSQLKLMSPAALDMILPLLFRALSFHATPLPPLSVTSSTTTIENRISETLNALLCGPYASTCMITLKRHLHPPPVMEEDISKWVQTCMGAHRTLRNYIRRSLCARLARAYISRTASVNYALSRAPSFISLERDLAERAWPKDDATAWDAGKLGRTLCRSVQGWVAFGVENEANAYRSGSEAILTEVAGTLKDVLEELDSRDDNSVPDEEEATAVGETLYHLASSVHQLKYVVSLDILYVWLIHFVIFFQRVRWATVSDTPLSTGKCAIPILAPALLIACSRS